MLKTVSFAALVALAQARKGSVTTVPVRGGGASMGGSGGVVSVGGQTGTMGNGVNIPDGCTTYNDGCNTCRIANGGLGACTMMMCIRQATPYCMNFEDGRVCTGPDDCTAGSGSTSLPEGARCTTQRSRGQSEPVPCAEGLVCHIQDQGMIQADRPNSGVCAQACTSRRPCMPPPCARPPEGCRYEAPQTDTCGCQQGCGRLVCQDSPLIDHVDPPHPVDPLVPAENTAMCDNSPRQMCRMMCHPFTCPANQCAMRTGSCCDFTCQATNGASKGPGASKTHERFLFEAWEKSAFLVWNCCLAEGLTPLPVPNPTLGFCRQRTAKAARCYPKFFLRLERAPSLC